MRATRTSCRETLDGVMAAADFLTVHVPDVPETRGLIGAKQIALLKPGAYFVNTARAAAVAEEPLYEALTSGQIRAAAFDVMWNEPVQPDDRFVKLDNVIVAPHALCWTDQCFAGNGAADLKAVLAVQKGQVPRGVVNRDVLERDGFKKKLEGFAKRFG